MGEDDLVTLARMIRLVRARLLPYFLGRQLSQPLCIRSRIESKSLQLRMFALLSFIRSFAETLTHAFGLFLEVTRDEVTRRQFFERRIDPRAYFLRVGAPRIEPAPTGRVNRARDLSLDLDVKQISLPRICDRGRLHERNRIWVSRLCHHGLRRSVLDQVASIHNGDNVGKILRDSNVVSDQHVRKPEASLKLDEQSEDLSLDGSIQRAGRLVQYHQFR